MTANKPNDVRVSMVQVFKELLHEAYEAGYCEAQNNPNGIGDRAERDKAAEQLLAGLNGDPNAPA